MSCGVFYSSTVSLKIAVLVLVVVFVLHVVGFALPRWSSLKTDFDVDYVGNIESNYHVGLWTDCSCASVLGTSACACVAKASVTGTFRAVQALETIALIGLITFVTVILFVTGTFRAVQALETIALIGLIISGIITFFILFSRQDKTLKTINIVLILGSGLFIVVGVIVYAAVCNDDYNDLFGYVEDLLSSLNMDTDPAKLSTSFILCAIAGALCLLVCTTLLIIDHRTATTINQPNQQLHTMPVQYSNQGQIIAPPPGQVVIHSTSEQPAGYVPTHYAGPPAYTPQYQPAPQGVPYKA